MTITSGLRPLSLRDVVIDDEFWSPRRRIVRDRMLPQQEEHLRTGGQFEALKLQWKPGDPHEPHIFWESDVAKWIEAASYVLATHPDPALDRAVDEAIDLLAGAQQPDGYLNVYFTVVQPGQRFTDLRDAHELYCLGHLIEAAVAHHDSTGKTSLLDIVRRYADLVVREFSPGGACEGGYDGHQEVELALIKLTRVTQDPRYLELARRMIEARGTQPYYFEREAEKRERPGYFDFLFAERDERAEAFREYNQSHLPVREQTEVVGHSVRAMYMLCAVADLASATQDEELLDACERLWQSTTGTKMYVTGALGSVPSIEGFGRPYELPNYTGYGETCAAIGLVMWAQRMANITFDGRYADVLERALYNGVLSGGSREGTSYFYGNPLASNGDVHRHEWFGVACCPPNLARLLSSLEQYAYADDGQTLAVHLYVAGTAHTSAGGGATITVETDYPDQGQVRIAVEPEHDGAEWTLALRDPSWSRSTRVLVNGETVDVSGAAEAGYIHLARKWRSGDRVDLVFDMDPVRVWAHPAVAAAAGKVALQRGPIVYCLEGVDHGIGTHLIALPRTAELSVEPDPVSGLSAITADGWAEHASSTPALYDMHETGLQPIGVRAIPYFAWANRGQSTMTVWIRES